MSRREAVLSAVVVFLVAIAIRFWAATVITFPRPEDTAYYVDVARNLLEGRGLTSDAIWSYGTPPLRFPRAAFEVWLPLPTFLAAVPMAILGHTFWAAQLSSIVIGGIVAVLAWRLAADVAELRGLPRGRARVLALGTGFASAVFLPLVLHSVLPDSTMLFGALVLGVCLLGARILRDPPGSPRSDRRVVALGVLIGLAALTRNEAIWLALSWAIAVWMTAWLPRAQKVGLVVGAAIAAIVVFAPWAVRNVFEFGSPLPGQAAANALSLDGRDIFAWQEPPTLARYLGAGIGTLVGLRVTGFFHNLLNVLLFLGIPVSAIGLLAMPWTVSGWKLRLPGSLPSLPRLPEREPEPPPPAYVPAPGMPYATPETMAQPTSGTSVTSESPDGTVVVRRVDPAAGADVVARPAERPLAYFARPMPVELVTPMVGPPSALAILVCFSAITFAATTLLFPVATTWGTFLHASAAIQVLLLLSALLALDRLIAEIGRRRGWTRPVAWLGPFLAISAGALFTLVLLPGFGRGGEGIQRAFEALPAELEAARYPLEVRGTPIITDYPIYLASITGAHALALPDESPRSVVDLASTFGAKLLVVSDDNEGIWPEVTFSDNTGTGLACFEPLPFELEGWEVYRIVCP